MIDDELRRLVAISDYVAGREFVQFIANDRPLIESAKPTLAELYKQGGDPVRRYLVDGILEHLFEFTGVEELFCDWRSDDELVVAFREAADWAGPIRRKRAFLTRVAELSAEILRVRGVPAEVMPVEIGIDSISLALKGISATEQLIVDCEGELVAKYATDEVAQAQLAKYAAEYTHWVPDDYAPWQQWVHLRE